jgi:predicted RNA-binding Zn ribbon-like protein
MNEILANLHEYLAAVKGLLQHPSVSEEKRKQLEELKTILDEKLLALLAQIEAQRIS